MAPRAAADREPFSTSAAFGTGLVAAAALATLGILYDMVLRLLFGPAAPTPGPWGAVRGLDPAAASFVVQMGAAVGPAGDERFWRGVVFERWRAGRLWWGAVLSALLFAARRLDPVNFVAYTSLGLVLAWLYRFTGRLLVTWMAQAALNCAMFALLFSGYE